MESKVKTPAFMRVVESVDRDKSYNRYLLRPLVAGEVVKVSSEQNFHNNQYVRIVRKGADGKWSEVFVTTWDTLEPLKKIS